MAQRPNEPQLGLAQEEPILEVSALSQLIRRALEGSVGRVLVRGEVSNSRCVSGHWYFSLKDSESRIDCVLFRSDAARSKCAPKDGSAVVVAAQVTHYPPQGRTQLQCSTIEPIGAGSLDAKYRALCEELRGLGYFDPARKVPIPAIPMGVAIVTSANSAAEADCLQAAAQTFPAARIILVDVRVQGRDAAPGIAAALAAIDAAASGLRIDLVLLVRGGGSLEDLWAFNERVVADAILAMRTPIVTGIGHESDTTIADLVADLRAPTPSRAVTETLASRAALSEELDSLAHRLIRAWEHHAVRAHSRIEVASRSRALLDPATGIEVRLSLLAQFAMRLGRGAARALEVVAARVTSVERTLEAIGPLAVLERGYSITLDRSGNTLRNAADATTGDRLRTILARGEIASVVEGTTQQHSNPDSR